MSEGEFRAALRRGLGRALQHVLQHGLGELFPVYLEACLENIAFDPQLENRGKWLASFVTDRDSETKLLSALVPRLANRIGESEDLRDACWNRSQQRKLAFALAQRGYVYEHSPCPQCRLETLETWAKMELLPSDIAQECHYDSLKSIRNQHGSPRRRSV
jgi:hypothetical protein